MRLILNLKAVSDFSYDNKYYSKFSGFIYSQLINTPYRFLHEKKGYKFFCFSNLFPLKIGKIRKVQPFREGETKFWIISSPDSGLIYVLDKKLEKIKEENSILNLGEMRFYLEEVKIAKPTKIKRKLTIKTETPIIVRIGKKTYERYNVKPPKNYKYLFWRSKWPLELFIESLTKNLLNKYKEFYKLKEEEFGELKNKVLPLFQRLEFNKTLVGHIIIDGKEQKFPCSLWRFHFDWLNSEQKKLLDFALDSGFGEKNNYGFGFVNVVD